MDTELDREMRFHLEMLTQQNMEKGMSEKEARKAALREFGNVELAKEDCRASWGIQLIDDFVKDLLFGFRQICKNKIHTSIIVLTLAICMGANTTAYNFVVKLVSDPYNYKGSERIVKLGMVYTKERGNRVNSIAIPHYKFVEENQSSFSDIGLIDDRKEFDLHLDGTTRRITTDMITHGVWKVTGVQPIVGRFFNEQDARDDKQKLIVIGEKLWNEIGSKSESLIGESLILNDQSYRVIGVAPNGFFLNHMRADAWIPKKFSEKELGSRYNNNYTGIAKLKPGVSVVQANQNLRALYEANMDLYPEDKDHQERTGAAYGVVRIDEALLQGLEQIGVAFKSIQYVTLVVLVIGCLNAGGMILVKGLSRVPELAMRKALGASSFRLARQLMVEIGIYFVMAGILSILVLKGGFASGKALSLDKIPWSSDWPVDAKSIYFTIGISALSALATGLFPLLTILKRDLMEFVKSGGRSMAGNVTKHRIHSAFVISQVSLAVILLTAAGVSVLNLNATLKKDIGFSTEGRIGIIVPQPDYRYAKGEEGYRSDILPLQEQILERIRSLPGVINASASNRIPSSPYHTGHSSFSMNHYQYQAGEKHANALRVVIRPNYFNTVGTKIISGRDFNETDTFESEPVIIISQDLVEKYYKGQNPIGMIIHIWGRDLKIIGVAEKVLDKPHFMDWEGYTLYFPYTQWSSMGRKHTFYLVHSQGDLQDQIRVIEDSIRDFDSALTPESTTFDEVFEVATFAQRLPMIMTSLFSGIALLLTGIGLYGLISFTVAERTKEFGIRMAIGAKQTLILKRVMAGSGRLISYGLLAGVGIALFVCSQLNPVLEEVNTMNPATFLAVITFVVLVSIFATMFPAKRAMDISIVKALQQN